jgi:hypothetical protein
LQSAAVAQQAPATQRCVPGLQHSPTLQSVATLQQSVVQRPAAQHSPALQSVAVEQQLPAEQRFVPGSQHSPALQSALDVHVHAPQRPSWQHSPALQSALTAQHGSHWWPWQHCPAWQSAVVQQSPATHRGGLWPAAELLAAWPLVDVPLPAAPPAPALPPLPQPGPAAQARARVKGTSAAIRKSAAEDEEGSGERDEKVMTSGQESAAS